MNRFVIVAVGIVVLAVSGIVLSRTRQSDPEASGFRPTVPGEASVLTPVHRFPTDSPSGIDSALGEPVDPALCDMTLTAAETSVDGSESRIGPGSVVCLEGGLRPPLHITSVHGEARRPVVFVNSGVVTVDGDHDDYAGIRITASTHVRVTGSGLPDAACGAAFDQTDQRCGIIVRGTGRGVSAAERSDWITVDHLEITGTSHAGMHMRTKPKEGGDRESFVQHGTTVHSNYIHAVGTEGLYLGSSFYDEGTDPVLMDTNVIANLVVESGWDGIQVGSAVTRCTIAHNTVVLAGVANRNDQNSGIINNRGSVCDIRHNVVVGSAAQGIFVQGNGENRIHDNVVIGAGTRQPDEGDGITIRTGSNTGRPVFVWHNTIVAPSRTGILFRNEAGQGNEVANNFIVAAGTRGPIDSGNLSNVMIEGNVEVETIGDAGFVAPNEGDFRLGSASPAIDAAVPGGDAAGVDLWGRPRPSGAAADAGAFEHEPGST